MGQRRRPALFGGALVTTACVLAACSSSPPHHAAARTTTTTTTAPAPTTAPPQGVAVPDVVGMKLQPARSALHAAGFPTVPLDKACNKGTPASQSVVAALSVPGRPPDVKVGATPLVPGTLRPKGSKVGITWSDCYPGGTEVPLVAGHDFAAAVRKLHLAGLDWACFSDRPATTTTGHDKTTTSAASGPTTSTNDPATSPTSAPAPTTTAPKAPPPVLSQSINAGSIVRAGTVVTLVMHHCPQ